MAKQTRESLPYHDYIHMLPLCTPHPYCSPMFLCMLSWSSITKMPTMHLNQQWWCSGTYVWNTRMLPKIMNVSQKNYVCSTCVSTKKD
jgi:hypothetical protein